jgi:hypothetical protein
VYTRLLNTEGLNAPEVMSSRENKVLYPYGVNGLYRSDNNWEMFFSAPLITFRTQDEERSGGYAIYRINEQTILEINYLRREERLRKSSSSCLNSMKPAMAMSSGGPSFSRKRT